MDRAVGLLRDYDLAKAAKDISTDPVVRIDARINGVVGGPPYRGRIYPYLDQQDNVHNIDGTFTPDEQAELETGYYNIRVG